jgi:ribosomal protein S27E
MRVAAPADTWFTEESRTGEHGREYTVRVPYMRVHCARCGNSATVYGHSEESYEAATCILRETCPKAENNWYAEP